MDWKLQTYLNLRVQSECGKIQTRKLEVRTLFTLWSFSGRNYRIMLVRLFLIAFSQKSFITVVRNFSTVLQGNKWKKYHLPIFFVGNSYPAEIEIKCVSKWAPKWTRKYPFCLFIKCCLLSRLFFLYLCPRNE